MTTVTIEEAQARLPELVERAAAGEEVVITRGDSAVIELRCRAERARPGFGGMKGRLRVLVEDERYLEDFRDYMP